jgi:CBS-domain-containing membrane protein
MLARDIMRPVNGELSSTAEAVEPTATVEDLLARLAGGSRAFRVVDGGGDALGAIDAAAVLSIVARDRQRRR